MPGVKDRVEEVDRAGVVYGLDCKDCNLVYIKETRRSVKKRAKEDKAHTQNGRTELSAAADHAWSGHMMDWTPRVLAIEHVTKERRIHGALAIHAQNKRAGTLNRDNGMELSKLWLELFSMFVAGICDVCAGMKVIA